MSIENFIQPVVLQGHGVQLEPLTLDHVDALHAATQDGQLWNLRFTSVPAPQDTRSYVEKAINASATERFAFAVRELTSNTVIGSTSYHDIVPAVKRVEIGWTWYGKSWQRTHVNTACKILLLQHAFETLHCPVVGWRTDNFNFASQKAIERLGAKKDGVLRHHHIRRDGTVRDTVMYSMTQQEWHQGAKAHLHWLLNKVRD